MEKVVLIRAAKSSSTHETNVTGVYPPLGLASLAATLRVSGWDPVIIDGEAERLPPAAAASRIPSGARVVGITSTTLGWFDARDTAAAVRARFPDAVIAAGGAHPTAFPEAVLRNSEFDAAVSGEAEATFPEFVRRAAEGEPFAGLPGCAVIDGEGDFVPGEPSTPPADLDALPHPAFDLLPIETYSSIVVKNPFTTLTTSRGCPYRCSFCSQFLAGGRYRRRSPANVVDEMARHRSEFGAREVIFFDETFGADRDAALGICRLLGRRNLGLRWNARSRADLLDRELLGEMKAAGCWLVHLGIESASPRILRSMGKGIEPGQAAETVRLAKSAGMQVHGYFMLGYPGESRAEIEETVSFSRRIGLDWASYTVTVPNPLTALFDEAVSRGLVSEDFWARYTAAGLKAIPRFRTEEFTESYVSRVLQRAYVLFYLRPLHLVRLLRTVAAAGGIRRFPAAARALMREIG